MTDAIEPWRRPPPPPPEPSHFATVAEVLTLVRNSTHGVSPATSYGRVAQDTLPAKLPHTQAFLAWALYYGTPDARTETLKALDRQ